jgi:hypothetical protein
VDDVAGTRDDVCAHGEDGDLAVEDAEDLGLTVAV